MNLDYKLNYYYHKYKDTALPNTDKFRMRFKKENGDFQYLNELIVMIINYQVKKYGQQLPDGFEILRKDNKNDKHTKGQETRYI